jgi:hypothetical protein
MKEGNRLWAFGDSFTQGYGCIYGDEYYHKHYKEGDRLWPDHLGALLGLEAINKGSSGASNDKILDTILHNYKDVKKGDTVIISMNYPQRLDVEIPYKDNNALDTVTTNNKLDFSKGFAFENYKLSMNPMEYEYSSIDTYMTRRQYGPTQNTDLFTLFDFSAKWDPVPTMLCQNHTNTIRGFWGQTAAFDKRYIKKGVLIMGETKAYGEARYIHGEAGKGTWTFYSGHDPEDYEHRVEEPPTDLTLHPNSPGYRLILNNILFPAAKKKKQKT